MKQFRIVKETSNLGRVRYFVSHRVRIFGINLFWSTIWMYSDGSLSDRYVFLREEDAMAGLEQYVKDYATRHEKFFKEVTYSCEVGKK